MKKYIILLIVLFVSSVSAMDLEKFLKSNNSNGYFPEDGKYVVFPKLCNNDTCFHLVAVSYIVANHGVRRLAVFSDTYRYLGVYSGFNEDPIKVSDRALLFPFTNEKYGTRIEFVGTNPPMSAYLDGEHYEFEKP